MEPIFEYQMVLTSIIIGLGVANILIGFGEMLRSRATVRESTTHLVAVAVLLLLMLQHWWDSWPLADVTYWTFPGLLLHLAGPVTLFLGSHIAFPRSQEGCDMLEYYHSQALLLWSLGALYVVTTIAYRPLIHGDPILSPRSAFRVAGLALCLVLALSRNRRVHAVGVWVAAGFLCLFVALFTLSARG